MSYKDAKSRKMRGPRRSEKDYGLIDTGQMSRPVINLVDRASQESRLLESMIYHKHVPDR